MQHQLKALSAFLCLVILIAFSLVNAPANAQEEKPKEEKPTLFNQLPEKVDDSKTMKSLSMHSDGEEEEGKESKSDNAESDDKNGSEDQDNIDKAQEDLTPEEKLWNKYKGLAAGQQESDTDPEKEQSADASHEDTEDTSSPGSQEEKPQEANTQAQGLKAILENYKKSQKSKGGMNTRSFGSIE